MSVPAKAIAAYDQPHHFEPLLPQCQLQPLVEATRRVFEKSLRLQSAAHPITLGALRELMRSMNSYYSNLIEGQGTHPINIEQALKANYSAKPDIAQRQRIAVAHIDAEKEVETFMVDEAMTEGAALCSGMLIRAHAALYKRLSSQDRLTEDGRVIEPGQLREVDVAVGSHQPPLHASVPAFLRRMDEVYGRTSGMDALLYSIAAAHQRAAWVHPFGDGNGRACRLQTHAALSRISGGLWSVSRGLARQRDKYYEARSNADMSRQGDLDGRGNLSEKMLRLWCEFFISTCDDQVSFMTQMLQLDRMRERIAALVLIRSESAGYPHYGKQLVVALHHVFMAGALTRGEFCQATGMSERSARRALAQLLKDGLLRSEGPKGPVMLGLPLDALHILLPNLYPEAAVANMER
jgi:Fic family protein